MGFVTSGRLIGRILSLIGNTFLFAGKNLLRGHKVCLIDRSELCRVPSQNRANQLQYEVYYTCSCRYNMGSGRDTDSEEDADSLSARFSRLEDIEEWDDSTRRKFLAILAATVAALVTTITVSIQAMFGVFTTEDEPRREDRLPGGIDDPPSDIRVQEYENEYRAIDDDGEVIESGPDGWVILERAVEIIPEGGTLSVRGRFEADSAIEVTKSIQLDGHGAYIAVQDSAQTAFEFGSEERYQTELVDSAETGAYELELDQTSEIRKGDMLLLEDVDGPGVLGRDQPAGEPHSVLELDGRTVVIEDTIVWRDGYESGTEVYVINPIEVRCTGFHIVSPAKDESFTGVMARKCRDSMFADLHLEKFGNRGIALEACANSRVRDCTILQSADIDSSDGYGIQIRAGSHDIVVEGCTAKECRHPLSLTPAGPREVASRSITFRDCFVSSDGSAALNCHGGSAHDVRFEGCTVHTWGEAGVRTGAQQTNVSGCEFRMDSHHAITTRNDGQEMVLTVSDTDIYGAGNAVHLDDDTDYEFDPLWKLVHLDCVRANGCARFFELDSGAVDRVRDLVIRNCSWDTVSRAGIRIENRVDGGSIKGNDFGDAPNDSHIRLRNGNSTDVRNLHISGNRFQRNSGEETFIRMSNARECVVSDNKFESESNARIYADDTDATHNIIKQNTYFGPGAADSAVQTESGSQTENNHFFDTGDDQWS